MAGGSLLWCAVWLAGSLVRPVKGSKQLSESERISPTIEESLDRPDETCVKYSNQLSLKGETCHNRCPANGATIHSRHAGGHSDTGGTTMSADHYSARTRHGATSPLSTVL